MLILIIYEKISFKPLYKYKTNHNDAFYELRSYFYTAVFLSPI